MAGSAGAGTELDKKSQEIPRTCMLLLRGECQVPAASRFGKASTIGPGLYKVEVSEASK